ncbi:unnamed protein product [Aphis gossypii]|uniref:MD-2-related lipid-recognition domain-containing protein n=1 Tax=Aphis gossypii TaxID=80765 RepID=A0A9P0J5V7_APHGO|nr:unnamed protein product [Aphis gossypii]
MIITKVIMLIVFFSLSNSNTSFMPNLPLGEYRMAFEKIYPCESKNVFQLNFYFSKKTLSLTEIKGNLTFLLPLDDTLILDVNAASWDSIGGWKPNSMVYTSKNACSNWKKLLGNVWNSILKSYKVSDTSCPIPSGNYTTTGLDIKKLSDHNFPKVYFYGKYKLTCKIKNIKNDVLGCVVLEYSLLRPWEKQFE